MATSATWPHGIGRRNLSRERWSRSPPERQLMGQYLLRRLLIAIPSLLGISVILFTVLALAPGDPFEERATHPAVPREFRAMLRVKFGLDEPVPLRYVPCL